MTRDDAEKLAREEAARCGVRWEPMDVQRLARHGRCGPPQWQFTCTAPGGRVTIRVDDRTGITTVDV